MIPPDCGVPRLKDQSSRPLFASSATTMPSAVPWKTRSPPVDRVWLMSGVRFDHSHATLFWFTSNATPLISHRSEEHTSELQSLAYLVCRLLLEKKKKKERKNDMSNKTLPNK